VLNGKKYKITEKNGYYGYEVLTNYAKITIGGKTYTAGSRKQSSDTLLKGEICGEFETFVRNEFETTTNTCPTSHPSGVINMRREYELWSDGSKRNYSAWSETSRTCAAIKQRTESENQILACPPLTPSGKWEQARTYDLLTDGSKKNHSSWTNVSVCYNQTPSVNNRTLIINEDTTGALTLTAVDDHTQMSYEAMSQPDNGTININGASLSFTPNADWNGSTSFSYSAKDPAGAISNTATVTITVRPVNDAPVAANTTLTVDEDTTGTVTLVATDVDGDALTYSIVAAPNATHGTVTLAGNKVTFTPKPNWNGTTSFTYQANDGAVNSNTATVSITITPVNDPPLKVNSFRLLTKESRPTQVTGTISR